MNSVKLNAHSEWINLVKLALDLLRSGKLKLMDKGIENYRTGRSALRSALNAFFNSYVHNFFCRHDHIIQ